MPRDIFEVPFDEGTRVKLKVFEDYFKEWLPVFISKPEPIWKEIQILDLFAGEGKDIQGVHGSPILILSILNANEEHIKRSRVKIKVVLNEYDAKKCQALTKNISLLNDKSLYQLEIHNSDFSAVFGQYYESMKSSVNFLFLDQNGIKQITEHIFKKLISLDKTDFLFFISSSYIKRFSELEEFKKYLSISKQDLKDKSYYHIHRIVLSYYRSLIPKDKSYFLAPFSIKKPSGIYGLIFGSNHTYGMEKFLSVSWKHDKLTGEANFDIDNEKIDLGMPSLFESYNIPSKRQVFESNLQKRILAGQLKTNHEVYMFTLDEGFLFRDANTVLKQLKDGNKITFNFKPITSKLHKEQIGSIKINV